MAKFLPSFPLFAACVAFAARSYISHQSLSSIFVFARRGGGGGQRKHTSAALAAARRASSVARLLLSRDDICGGTDARGFFAGVNGAEAGAGLGVEPRV